MWPWWVLMGQASIVTSLASYLWAYVELCKHVPTVQCMQMNLKVRRYIFMWQFSKDVNSTRTFIC